MEHITADRMRFTDEQNRERIFSGVNVVDKSPYSPGEQQFPYLNADVLRRFAENGWNLIRLGFTWGKIEPQIGRYNEAYLDSVSDILDLCEEYGIYVFLDMHQDLYSPVTNGDGAPPWAALTDGLRTNPTRYVWAEDYFWGKACHRCFDHFWANTPVQGKGLQDRFADCWVHIVHRIGGKAAVIGFDVFNEPFPGKSGGKCFRRIVTGTAREALFGKHFKFSHLIADAISRERERLLLNHISYPLLRQAFAGAAPPVEAFDKTKYSPFLQKTADAIRGAGSDKLLFLENCYFSNLGIPCSVQPVLQNGSRDTQQVFAPHAYDFMVDTPAYRYASAERVDGMFAEHRRTQERLQIPVIVGEWGGFGAQDDDSWLGHIAHLLTVFDRNKWSQTYWQYSDAFFDSPLMRVFVRPYPQAVPGEIESYRYDSIRHLFHLHFTQHKAGECVICTPFPVKRLTLDNEAAVFEQRSAQTVIHTPAGQHILKIKF
ncbi:MAG: cellulase family glycosylhydrolase [Clostridia bacterium]|nr:cellulase family glycosylhydrolase [Clostridia bacterium]